MPVTINIKPVPWLSSSNKQKKGGKGEGEKYPIAYSYRVSDMGKIWVTDPFIDKISLTVRVKELERQGVIREVMMDYVKSDGDPAIQNSQVKAGYKYAIEMTEPITGATVLIQADPKGAKTKNFVRLELNPSALGMEGLFAIKCKLAETFLGAFTWNHAVRSGKATRIDVATDLFNVPVAGLIYGSTKPGKAHIYVGQEGDLETVYTGVTKPGKASNQVIYDKSKELIDHDQPGEFLGERCRIEMIYKYPHQKFAEIATIATNPFEWVTICYPYEPPEGFDAVIWKLFVDSCQLRGLANALQQVPKDWQDKIGPYLKEIGEVTWRPTKLWSRWPVCVKASGLLEPGPNYEDLIVSTV